MIVLAAGVHSLARLMQSDRAPRPRPPARRPSLIRADKTSDDRPRALRL